MADTDPSESPWAGDVPAPATSSLPEDPWADRRRPDPLPTLHTGSAPGSGGRHVAGPATGPGRVSRQVRNGAEESRSTDAERGGATRRNGLLAAGAAVIVAAVAAMAVLSGGDADGDPTTAEPGSSTSTPAGTSDPERGEEAQSTTTLSALTPVLDDPDEFDLPDDDTLVPTTLPLDGLVPALETATMGAPPVWTEWEYPLPPVLQQLTEPTEVVVLTTSGQVHRIELPSGTVRSIDTGDLGRSGSMHVSGESLLLQQFDTLVLLRTGAPVLEVEIGVGIGSVVPRGDTGEFLVAPSEWSTGPPPLWLVDEAGEATSLAKADDPLATYADFPLQFLPDGELLVFDAGGTYAVPDAGTPQRVSPGLLFATGRRHVIVRECDATLQCEFVLIDLESGERRVAPLDVSDRFAFYSQGSVAPDGRTMLYADWNGSRPATLLMDLDTGAVVDDELLRAAPLEFGPLDAWAGDGSGVFLRAGSSIAFLSRDGSVGVELDGLGRIAALAVR